MKVRSFVLYLLALLSLVLPAHAEQPSAPFFYWQGGSPTWTPANLTAPSKGIWVRFGAQGATPTVTLSGANISTVTDSWGSASSVAAPSGSVVPIAYDAGSGMAYAQLRSANAGGGHFPGLTGSGIVDTTASKPFTLAAVVRFVQGPASSTDSTGTFLSMGGTMGAGGLGPVVMSIAPANQQASVNSIIGWPTGASAPCKQLWGYFGRETLATGASGATIPSTQVVTLLYDGTTLSVWVDGVIVPPTTTAYGGITYWSLVTGCSITQTTSNFTIGRWFNGSTPADTDVYEAAVTNYAWSYQQIKQYATYAMNRYRIAKTGTKLINTGDSEEEGWFASNLQSTTYNAQLPARFAADFAYPLSQTNTGVHGTLVSNWLNTATTQPNTGLPWQAITYAYGYSPMATANIAAFDWGFNDLNAPVTMASWQSGMASAASIIRGWALPRASPIKGIVAETIVPCDATCQVAAPAQTTSRATWNAATMASVGSVFDAAVNWDSTATTALPGVPAWSSGTTYAPPSSGGPPWLVSFSGGWYAVKAASTGVTPGTDATKWTPLDGAPTIAGAVTTIADPSGFVRGDANDIHMGINRNTGDTGPAVYAVYKEYTIAHFLGLMSIADPANDNGTGAAVVVLALGAVVVARRRRAA